MITLRSSDGENFEVDEIVALESLTIKKMIDDGADNGIPIPIPISIPNVTSKILSKVIEYCKKHTEIWDDDDLRTWDDEFVNVDRNTLRDLILASNYLNIKGLLDLTTQAVADMIKGKTPEEIRTIFNLKSEIVTPEEEEKIRRENTWAFE